MSHRYLSRVIKGLLPFACVALVCIAWFCTPVIHAQNSTIEKHIPTSGKPQIIVSGTTDILIKQWEKSEVFVTAYARPYKPTETEIQIDQKQDKIDIVCKPSQADKTISISLLVPKKAVVTYRVYDTKIEVKEPGERTSIHYSEAEIDLNVPDTSKVDLRDVRLATWFRSPGPNSISSTSVAQKVLGNGPPYIKIDKTVARVGINRPQNYPSVRGDNGQRQLTTAAKTLALRGGLMGESIRKSEPRLANLNDDLTANKNSTGDDASDLTLRSQLVNLNVSVTDNKGRAIPGLSKEDFSVYEDDVQQAVSHFATEQTPFNLVLLLDMSGSVVGKKGLIIEAALHFIDVVSPNDKVAVVTFTTDVAVVSHLTQDRDSLRDHINHLIFPVGGTSFYDALGYTLTEELRNVRGQRNAVVILTDGEDNALFPTILAQIRNNNPNFKNMFPAPLVSQGPGSFLTFDQLLDGVRESDALIYPIHIDSDNPATTTQSSAGKPGDKKQPGRSNGKPNRFDALLEAFMKVTDTARAQLQELADASGGRVYNAHRIEDLKKVYDEVAAEMRTVYSLAYAPTSTSANDRLRIIKVKVNNPDAVARTRHGYYLNKRP